MFLSNFIRPSIAFLAMMFVTLSFVACSENDDPKPKEEKFEITADGKEYKVENLHNKADESSFVDPKGTAKIKKDGSKYTIEVKDLNAKDGLLDSKLKDIDLDFKFDVTLSDIVKDKSYAIDFAKKDGIEINDIPFEFDVDVTDAMKNALGLTTNSIALEGNSMMTKKAKITLSVEKLADDKKIDYKGKDYFGWVSKEQLQIGVKITAKYTVPNLTNQDLINSVKNNTIKSALELIFKYSGSDAATNAKKTALTNILNTQKTIFTSTGISATKEIVAELEKK